MNDMTRAASCPFLDHGSKGIRMFRNFALICTCMCAVFAFSQSATNTNYRIATVLAVTPHQSSGSADPATPTYDVSVRVGNAIYVVLYTPPLGLQNAKYAAGAEVVVLVGEKTITYNDISGNSIAVPILRRKTIAAGIR